MIASNVGCWRMVSNGETSNINSENVQCIQAAELGGDHVEVTTRMVLDDDMNLLHAADTESVGLVKRLLRQGSNVNLCDFRGQTPLIRAALNEHEEILKLLLRGGAHIHLTDVNKVPALHVVARKGLEKGINIILNHVPDVVSNRAIDCGGPIAVNCAGPLGGLAADALGRDSAKVNAHDKKGNTCLHCRSMGPAALSRH